MERGDPKTAAHKSLAMGHSNFNDLRDQSILSLQQMHTKMDLQQILAAFGIHIGAATTRTNTNQRTARGNLFRARRGSRRISLTHLRRAKSIKSRGPRHNYYTVRRRRETNQARLIITQNRPPTTYTPIMDYRPAEGIHYPTMP